MGEINKMVEIVHQMAKDKGWWDEERTPLEIHALIHSEISEATEAYRNDMDVGWHKGEKPCGEPVELADAVIRIMDYFGHMGWSLESVLYLKMKYNEERPYRHGGKRA